ERAGVSRYTVVKLENAQAADIKFKILEAILSELHLSLTVTDTPVSGITVLGERTA
ncbi:MAG: DNA-binding Xre family transcriptional regulator, partial [Gammaproteobacteria bacterium]